MAATMKTRKKIKPGKSWKSWKSGQILGVLALFAGAALAGGCSGNQEFLGQKRNAPDEFAVYSRAPLSLPPDFSLRPPAPGAPRPQTVVPRKDAIKAILGNRAPSAGAAGAKEPNQLGQVSPGIQSLLRQSGGLDADPMIRTTVNRESSILAEEDDRFASKLIFWRGPKETGKALDPEKEGQRLRKATAEGKPLAEDAKPQPTIQRPKEHRQTQRERKGFWGWLFFD